MSSKTKECTARSECPLRGDCSGGTSSKEGSEGLCLSEGGMRISFTQRRKNGGQKESLKKGKESRPSKKRGSQKNAWIKTKEIKAKKEAA